MLRSVCHKNPKFTGYFTLMRVSNKPPSKEWCRKSDMCLRFFPDWRQVSTIQALIQREGLDRSDARRRHCQLWTGKIPPAKTTGITEQLAEGG